MSQKVLGNLSRGLVFVVSAPAGTGKTTLVRMLVSEFPEVVQESVSCTTRAPRAGEVQGKDYHFLTEEEFEKKRWEGEFLEYANVFGKWYGTSRKQLEEKLLEGKHVVLVIDTQGALHLQEMGFEATYIFVAPPSLEVLKERLAKRQTESEEKRLERLSWAQKEIEQASFYDFQVVNGDLNVAYEVLKSIVIAQEHRVKQKKESS